MFLFKAMTLLDLLASPSGFIHVGKLPKLICLFLPVSLCHDIEVLCSAKVFLPSWGLRDGQAPASSRDPSPQPSLPPSRLGPPSHVPSCPASPQLRVLLAKSAPQERRQPGWVGAGFSGGGRGHGGDWPGKGGKPEPRKGGDPACPRGKPGGHQVPGQP